MFVDYQWAGVGCVLLGWIAFRHRAWWLLLVGLAAVLGEPQRLGAAGRSGGAAGRAGELATPRWRWVFYGYYVGHLAVLALIAYLLA